MKRSRHKGGRSTLPVVALAALVIVGAFVVRADESIETAKSEAHLPRRHACYVLRAARRDHVKKLSSVWIERHAVDRTVINCAALPPAH